MLAKCDAITVFNLIPVSFALVLSSVYVIVSRQPQLFEFYPWCTNKEEMFVLRAYMHIFPSPIVGWTVLVFNMDISKTLSN